MPGKCCLSANVDALRDLLYIFMRYLKVKFQGSKEGSFARCSCLNKDCSCLQDVQEGQEVSGLTAPTNRPICEVLSHLQQPGHDLAELVSRSVERQP